MEQDYQFEMFGTFKNRVQKVSIHFIPNSDSITINSSTGQKLFELYFQEENIYFQWDDQMENIDHESFVFLWINKEEFKITGNQKNMVWLFSLCKGRFLFLQKSQNTQRTFVQQNDTGIIYKLQGKCNKNYNYFEKILFQKQEQKNLSSFIPEEIKVLKLVNKNKCPYLQSLEIISYDGSSFTYCYKIKRYETLRQFIQKTPNLKLSQILEIIRQLLQVSQYFESINLVHNRLDIDNILYSNEENVIQISNFQYSHLQQIQQIKIDGQIIDHESSGNFSQSQLTTAANIKQIGIVFNALVFGSQDDIKKSSPQENFCTLKLTGLIMENQTKVNQIIIEMISSMLAKNIENRQKSSFYLSSKIFQPSFKQQISLMELKLHFKRMQENDQVNEENKILNTIYILKTKFK